MTPSRRARVLAWSLGLSGVVACTFTAGVVIALAAPASFLLVYLVGVLMGLLGALVASQQPRNSIGWLMCSTSLVISLIHLPIGYGYAALVIQHGGWPLGTAAAWLGSWTWVLGLLSLPLISVRFPDGKVPRRWRTVDWLAIAGTVLFALAIALQRPDVLLGFAPIPGEKVALLTRFAQNPLGNILPRGLLSQVQGAGLSLIVAAYAGAAASLYARFRRAPGDERLQLKWFAYSGVLVAVALVYGGAAWNFFGQPLYLALTPLEIAAWTLPAAIGIAILRYRLYDIDLIINRTLVYGALTAILGAVYAGVVTLLNRLFIAASGQKSDAAYVVTAFVVVVASSPVKDWLQRQVDKRIAHRSPSAVLDELRADVNAVVSVIDVHKIARRLLDDAVSAFDVRSAAVYLHPSSETPLYSFGTLNGGAGVEVALRYEDQDLGRLVLGSRRGDLEYSQHDLAALQQSADSIAEALALAAHLGFRPLPRSRAQREPAVGG